MNVDCERQSVFTLFSFASMDCREVPGSECLRCSSIVCDPVQTRPENVSKSLYDVFGQTDRLKVVETARVSSLLGDCFVGFSCRHFTVDSVSLPHQ